MLEPLRHKLSKQRIILASGATVRKEALKQIGLKFDIENSDFEENLDKSFFRHPSDYVKENARQKAVHVWNRSSLKPDLIIGADTVVTLDNEIMEKPKNQEDAFKMLKKLSGRKNIVYTGVALLTKRNSTTFKHPNEQNQMDTNESNFATTLFHESTDVFMTKMTDDIIRGYIATGEAKDKAGSYAIQSNGATLIERIEGDYFNVIGMPLHHLCKELKALLSD